MANTILTPTEITREAQRILHQKLNFIGNCNRQYDDRFANDGAKIGDTLQVRMPAEYTVRSGATLSAQDHTESKVDLTVATQKGVDVNFTSAELTLDLQDFSARILEPAMSVLAANVEADALSMYKDVYNIVDNDTNSVTFRNLMQGKQKLTDALAPGSQRCGLWSSAHTVDLVDGMKGLFNAQSEISKQFKEGMMGRVAGMDHYENTLVADHTTGTAAKTTGYLVNGASQTGATLTVDTGTTTFLKGDIITIAGVNRVHPETKADTGVLQQFVVTADSGASATSLSISPSITTSTGAQNVSGSPADNAAITKVGAGASETLNSSMLFHKDAFAFATADLIDVSQYGAWGAREVFDGISLRIARQYDINNDQLPCRIDILYGYKAIRPQLATRIHADG